MLRGVTVDDADDLFEEVKFVRGQPVQQNIHIVVGSRLMHYVDVAPELVCALNPCRISNGREHFGKEGLVYPNRVPIGRRSFCAVVDLDIQQL